MIFNPILAGSGKVKNVVLNPAGTSVEDSGSTDTPTFVFRGLTKANIRSGCIALAFVSPDQYGALFISKTGETCFTQSGMYNFRITQDYDSVKGIFAMESNAITSGRWSLIIVLA